MKVLQGFLILIILAGLVFLGWVYLGKPDLVLSHAPKINPLQVSVDQLTQNQTKLEARLNQLEKQVQQVPQFFTLPEAFYYLNIAHLHLVVFHDIPTALKLMQWTQQRFILTQNTPLPLQEALSADIHALQGVAVPNITDINQKIAAIETMLVTLPLRTRQAPTPEPTANTATQSGWQQALNNTWMELKTLIRIQPRNTSMDYVLFDETILRQTVRVELERANIAAILGQTDLYQASLQQAVLALEQFFDKNDTQVQKAIASLQGIAKQVLVPQIPVADRALMWLQTHTS